MRRKMIKEIGAQWAAKLLVRVYFGTELVLLAGDYDQGEDADIPKAAWEHDKIFRWLHNANKDWIARLVNRFLLF